MKDNHFDHLFKQTFQDFEGDDTHKASDWAVLETRLENIAPPIATKSKIGQRLLLGLLALMLALNGCWFFRQLTDTNLNSNHHSTKQIESPSSNPVPLALEREHNTSVVQDTQRRKVIVYDTIHKEVIVYKTIWREENKRTESTETTTALIYTPEGKLLDNQTTTTEKKEKIKTTMISNLETEKKANLNDIYLDTMQKNTNIVADNVYSDSMTQHFLPNSKVKEAGIKVAKRRC